MDIHIILSLEEKSTGEYNFEFFKKRFFHLVGLQYLDIRELKKDREEIFNKIEYNSDFLNLIVSDFNYYQILERVKFMIELESFLDSNKTVFKFNNRTNSFSLIDADYILKNSDTEKNKYVFISKEDKKSGTYFCRSAFTRDKSETDYTEGHTPYTLLYKEKINLLTNEKTNSLYPPVIQKNNKILKHSFLTF